MPSHTKKTVFQKGVEHYTCLLEQRQLVFFWLPTSAVFAVWAQHSIGAKFRNAQI